MASVPSTAASWMRESLPNLPHFVRGALHREGRVRRRRRTVPTHVHVRFPCFPNPVLSGWRRTASAAVLLSWRRPASPRPLRCAGHSPAPRSQKCRVEGTPPSRRRPPSAGTPDSAVPSDGGATRTAPGAPAVRSPVGASRPSASRGRRRVRRRRTRSERRPPRSTREVAVPPRAPGSE